MQWIKIFVLVVLVVGLGFFAKEYFARRSAVKALGEAYRMTSDCHKSGSFEYPIVWESKLQVPDESIESYRECQKNTEEFANLKGIDVVKVDVEILCRCRNVFSSRLRKEFKVDDSENLDPSDCRFFQALDSIEQQCREFAVRK